MKTLALLFMAGASVAWGNPIEAEDGRFRVEFPKGSGWSAVREVRPGPHSIQWIARHEERQKLFLFSVINSPVKNPDAPLSEHAAEWRKSVEPSADAIDSQRFLEINGVPACELAGRISNAGASHFFLQYLIQIRHVTYQVTALSRTRLEASDAEVAAFLASIRIKPEPNLPTGQPKK